MPGNTTALAGLRFFLVVLSCNGDADYFSIHFVALVSLPPVGKEKKLS